MLLKLNIYQAYLFHGPKEMPCFTAYHPRVEKEQTGSFTDSILAVMLAAMLHDSGMTIARKNHELY